ncbi:DUF3999 domain-containing protein [Flagellimonas sp. HMM57]|uniref:DUF3999 family protein n=1 Tax=unclassified Flagellimonas TaxID=2644544 RepID=UPI0013D1D196|nr:MULTISPECIES: DUF3999 family protein [unclassified Flagellimonas]UII76547.1 DUF3999 domain-containing protein [Flagellimonas sp. HMM57]
MRTRNKFYGLLLILSCNSIIGQLQEYEAKIALEGIADQWHAITLPHTVFDKVKQDMFDMRIYGVTATDTLEAPYILKTLQGESIKNNIDFKLLNTTKDSNGYYYTFEVPTTEVINHIKLNLKNKNFDAKLILEGSQDQNNWFTILEDYRILSIKNSQTNYSFTELDFPNSKYLYYRVFIQSDVNPNLDSASIAMNNTVKATYEEYQMKGFRTVPVEKETYIDIYLKQRVPISFLKINVKDTFDYYRPITIKYVTDSVETEKGWNYYYRNLASGTLTSIEKNEFKFPSTLAKRLRVEIQNHDNQPLNIGFIEAKGYSHELVARFTEPADYFLAYGNADAKKPLYDISLTRSNIPKNLSKLTIGPEQLIPKTEKPQVQPLFENKWWLWGIMILVVLLLGGFTLKMMQKKV